jgi:phosphoribosylamine--glycine ligase
LIIGGGGREHALAWKIAQSPKVDAVYLAPGNAGTAREPKVQNVAIAAEDIPALVSFVSAQDIALTLVGPELPLVQGVVDAFNAHGLRCFGPTQEAAQLEGSKAFAKAFMQRHGIPTAISASFTRVDEAGAYIRAQGTPIVVKADGLAAGKGVVIAHSQEDAIGAVHGMLVEGTLGRAGSRVVVEEYLSGEEASYIVIAAGEQALPLATSQDHKARDEGDRGPNTGGMGAYSPAPVVTPEVEARILRQVIEPTLRGMAAEGLPYTGFLYAGLMIAPDGTPKVLEFNCRLGDPEAQAILMRLRSDLVELCEAALEGSLSSLCASWDSRSALGIVMAAEGYPGTYRRGQAIQGLPVTELADCKVFHAGTAERDGQIVTAGGRVLCVVGLGESVRDARERAYKVAQGINWEGSYYRRDIGYRAIAREDSRT